MNEMHLKSLKQNSLRDPEGAAGGLTGSSLTNRLTGRRR